MVLYEFVGIARADLSKAQFGKFLRNIAMDIMEKGGVVRSIEHFGADLLPFPMRNRMGKTFYGRYWSIHFNSSPFMVKEVMARLKYSEESLRHEIIKKGHSLKDLTTAEVFVRSGLPCPRQAILTEAMEKIEQIDRKEAKAAIDAGYLDSLPQTSSMTTIQGDEDNNSDANNTINPSSTSSIRILDDSESRTRLLSKYRGLDINEMENQKRLLAWKQSWLENVKETRDFVNAPSENSSQELAKFKFSKSVIAKSSS